VRKRKRGGTHEASKRKLVVVGGVEEADAYRKRHPRAYVDFVLTGVPRAPRSRYAPNKKPRG